MDILELSYQQLPNHVKPCFLYFAAFLVGKEILTYRLKSAWIAEGFIEMQDDENGRLENAAETYLNDLIARS